MSGPERIRALAEMLNYTRISVRQNTLLVMRLNLASSETEIPKEVVTTLNDLILKTQGVSNQDFASTVEKHKEGLSEENYKFIKMMINSLEFRDLY